MPKLSYKWAIRLGSLAIFLIAWQLIGGSVDPLLYSTPLLVVSAFVQLTVSGILPTQLALTLWTFFLGYVIASVGGILIGAAMARSAVVENALDPYVNAFYSTPYVAVVPLFIIWFGTGFNSRLAVVILSVVFVVIINTFAGFKNVSKTLVATGRSFGLSGVPLYGKVVFPASLPYIVGGLRLGIGRGLIGAIVAELFLQLVGLGYLLQAYAEILQVADVMAIVFVIGILGVCLTEALKYVERHVEKWRVTA